MNLRNFDCLIFGPSGDEPTSVLRLWIYAKSDRTDVTLVETQAVIQKYQLPKLLMNYELRGQLCGCARSDESITRWIGVL